MDGRDVLELVIWVGLVFTRTAMRLLETLLEWLFVGATWIALLVIGAVMACQRGGLPWRDPSDARATPRSLRATSRSAGSTPRRAPLR